jgi:hypothetical protein
MLQINWILIENLSCDWMRFVFFHHTEVQFIGGEIILELGNEELVETFVGQGQAWIFLFF